VPPVSGKSVPKRSSASNMACMSSDALQCKTVTLTNRCALTGAAVAA
jgi:hypothetical protein